ncbi:hypothetical protein TNCV_2557521 [Trichonephila clavipes]|nr:hypothetical protein TNCV_2557521 [Trichonephila clavipes]
MNGIMIHHKVLGAQRNPETDDSLVVKVTNSWLACYEFDLVPLKIHHVERAAAHIKSVEAQTPSRWCGAEVRRGGASSGVILVT